MSNAAVAATADLTYVRARAGDDVYVLAEALVERVLGSDGVEVLDRFPGSALEGVRYEPPFAYIAGSDYGPLGHSVLLGDFVTAAGRHRPRAHRDRVRRGRLPPRARSTG